MHIVLVDMSRTVRHIVGGMLTQRGHVVLPFGDGPEAIECLRSDPRTEVLITSAVLPSMSGLELCWEARLLASNRRSIYVILMSTNRSQDKIVEALDSGADDYIHKPPVAEELYARLRAVERLGQMQRELIKLATTDTLTGILNRRAFFDAAVTAAEAARAGSRLSAIMVDIDHFKRINDRYGHAAGDLALVKVARELASEEGVVGRLGGEEFALLLPETPGAMARDTAQRLCDRMAGLAVETEKGALRLTCSFGVGEWQQGDDIDRLLKRADAALYAAKNAGRNRVVTADAALMEAAMPALSAQVA